MANKKSKYIFFISFYVTVGWIHDQSLNELLVEFSKKLEWYDSDLGRLNSHGRLRTYKFINADLDLIKKVYAKLARTMFFISLIKLDIDYESLSDLPIYDNMNGQKIRVSLSDLPIYDYMNGQKIRVTDDRDLDNFVVKVKASSKRATKVSDAKRNKLAFSVMKDLDKLGTNSNSRIMANKVSSSRKTYITLDNGIRPFKVIVDKKNGIQIYTYLPNKYEDDFVPVYDVLIKHIKKYKSYWSGFDSSYNREHGNAILIEIDPHTYIFVGDTIYEFKAVDTIVDFISPVGNNDVPYPIAYGTENTYFMLDQVYVKNTELELDKTVQNSEHMYREFYGFFGHLARKGMPRRKSHLIKIPFKDLKMIQKRLIG